MRLSSISTIYRKEMLDMVRDRRTLISMVLVPVAAMPVLFLFMGRIISSAEKRAGEEAVTIAVQGSERLPGLLNALVGAGFRLVPKADLKAAVEKKEIAAGVEPVVLPSGVKEVRIYADQTREGSGVAAGKIRTALDLFKENLARQQLLARGVPPDVLSPFTVKRVDIAPAKKMAGMFWGSMLGYVVVLLMFSGGMYPAIDLTAGEKERRTLEVLLSAPAGRDEIILAKILATTSAVAITALLSILSLVVSLRYADFGKASKMLKPGGMPLDPSVIALVMLALVPTAIMAASIMVAIALFAKSFKEAQSYLTPLVMAVIFPLIAGMLPGIQLTPLLALIPLFNVCQLIKEIFQGDFNRLSFAITMASNVVYAGIAFYAAVQVFKSEKVLFRT
ncbi:MAG: ABC transporter permease [Bryobacteraceae bacterium]|jgi:sodium transport system permease protein